MYVYHIKFNTVVYALMCKPFLAEFFFAEGRFVHLFFFFFFTFVIRNIESLLYRRQFLSLVTMHKFIFKYRRCLASFHFNITQSARRPNKIILPKAKTTSKSLFLFQTSLLWNCLPPRLTAEPSIIVFKNELRKLTCKHSASLSGMPTPCTYPPPPPCAPQRIHAAQLFTTFTLAHTCTCTCTSFKAVNPLIGDKPLGHPNKDIIIISND